MHSRTTNKISTPLFAILALILFGVTNVKAAAGYLDTAFGNGGSVITAFTWPNQHAYTRARDVAVQPDGKIVVTGSLLERMLVVRYNANGSLDPTFGFSGSTQPPYTFLSNGYGVAVQPDGRIVVVGGVYTPTLPNHEYLVVRFDSNGAVDPSFGAGGAVRIAMGTEATDIAIQPDGKIVIVGPTPDGMFCLARLNPGGSLDTSFDGDGKAFAPGGGAQIVLQQDGKIVVAGGTGSQSMLARFNPDGSPDVTFDGDGIVLTSVGLNWGGHYNALAIQSDGKIVAGGIASDDYESDFASVVRYQPTGAIDTSFYTARMYAGGPILSLVIRSNGKILAVGGTYGVTPSAFLLRFNPNGNPNGYRYEGFRYSSFFHALALQPDGRVVAGGFSYAAQNETAADILLARYLPENKSFDFDSDGSADISVFRPSDTTWYLNRSTQGFAATQFGLPGDQIVPADYDNDGKTDIAIFRDGTWWWIESSTGTVTAFTFGQPGDIAVPADFTGDGYAELTVFRNGEWWMRVTPEGDAIFVLFGQAGDRPLPADYDGDGRADQAVYRNGEWHLNGSTQGYFAINWGLSTDRPVAADYDGDGKTDPAVYRDGNWYILGSLHGWLQYLWGLPSDVPVPADYDGDGQADAAVFRDGVWYLRLSTGTVSIQQFGSAGDKPVPSAFVP